MIENISIYNNSRIKNNKDNRRLLSDTLRRNGFKLAHNGELLIVIGGDGTFLSVMRNKIRENPIFVGFNTGNLGAFLEFDMNDIDRFVQMLTASDYHITEYPIFDVLINTPQRVFENFFINELKLSKRDEKIVHMKVKTNGRKLGNYYGDGLIVSSAIGANGYNSASHVLNFGAEHYMQLTPSNVVQNRVYNSLTKETILFPDDTEFELYPNIYKYREFSVTVDGKPVKIDNIKSVKIFKSKKTIRILRSNDFEPISYFKNKMIP